MTVYEGISLMINFSMLIVTIIISTLTLILSYTLYKRKK